MLGAFARGVTASGGITKWSERSEVMSTLAEEGHEARQGVLFKRMSIDFKAFQWELNRFLKILKRFHVKLNVYFSLKSVLKAFESPKKLLFRSLPWKARWS